MSYSDFINTLVNPIHVFFDSFGYLISQLMNNYIFITFLGLVIFPSFFHFVFDLIFKFFDKDKSVDDIADKKRG